jgi:hypothetical protein
MDNAARILVNLTNVTLAQILIDAVLCDETSTERRLMQAPSPDMTNVEGFRMRATMSSEPSAKPPRSVVVDDDAFYEVAKEVYTTIKRETGEDRTVIVSEPVKPSEVCKLCVITCSQYHCRVLYHYCVTA